MSVASQRRFANMGQNIFMMVNNMVNNQTLCRLLTYTDVDPLSESKPDVKGINLINRNICIKPSIPDEIMDKEGFIIILLNSFTLNPTNNDFKNVEIRIDIAIPFDEWIIQESSLRVYMIMEEIDKMFNQYSLAGIGSLRFKRADRLVFSPQMGGYTMEYTTSEFN